MLVFFVLYKHLYVIVYHGIHEFGVLHDYVVATRAYLLVALGFVLNLCPCISLSVCLKDQRSSTTNLKTYGNHQLPA